MTTRKHSLFGKLLMVFAMLFLAILATFFISFKLRGHKPFARFLYESSYNYSRYLVEDIGVPVTDEGLKRVARKTKVGIIFNQLKSREGLPDLSKLVTTLRLNDHFYVSRVGRKKFVVLETERGTYAFLLNLDFKRKFPILPLSIASFISLIFLSIAYHVVRRIFVPLQEVKECAQSFAQGDFSYPLAIKGPGELSDLSYAIKEMGKKIQDMLESKRDLLLAIAHELRTPIARAKLSLELMDASVRKKELDRELTEMSELISDILESERMKEGHKVLNLERVNLNTWLQSLLEHYKNENIEYSGREVALEVDQLRYGLVVKNILSNALRHRKGSAVNLKLTETCLSISNHGEPIPSEEISKITGPFYRPEKSRVRAQDGSGVGLGLYLVSQIVKAHGHQLEIDSDRDQTTFKIRFQRDKKGRA